MIAAWGFAYPAIAQTAQPHLSKGFHQVSHRVSCQFRAQVIESRKTGEKLQVKIKLVELDGELNDEVYCKGRLGDEEEISFSKPHPSLKESETYTFSLFVSGGKTAEGVAETFQWMHNDFQADPIHKITPRGA